MPASKSKNDSIFEALGLAGYTTGTISDRERKRLLALLGFTEPKRLTMNDLYKLAGERPRL